MTSKVYSCDTRDTLERVAQIMWDRDCGSVPIVDGHNHVVGAVTDRDCAMAAYLQGKPLAQIRVVDVISRHVAACEPSTSIADAMNTMRHCAIRRLPVVDTGGCLVGIITLGDIALAAVPASLSPGADAIEVARTLAALCEHQQARHA